MQRVYLGELDALKPIAIKQYRPASKIWDIKESPKKETRLQKAIRKARTWAKKHWKN